MKHSIVLLIAGVTAACSNQAAVDGSAHATDEMSATVMAARLVDKTAKRFSAPPPERWMVCQAANGTDIVLVGASEDFSNKALATISKDATGWAVTSGGNPGKEACNLLNTADVRKAIAGA